MKRMLVYVLCGGAFVLAFVAYSLMRPASSFWEWTFEREAKACTKNKCMVAFLINDAYRRGLYSDVALAYSTFKDVVDVIDVHGRLREKVVRSSVFTKDK